MTRLDKILILLISLIVLNLAGLNYLTFKNFKTIKPQEFQSSSNDSKTSIEYIDKCGQECQEYIEEKVAGIKITPVPTSKTTIVTSAPRQKIQSTQYFPISVSGSSMANDWTSLSGTDFYFNTTDYAGLKQIQFEANIRLFNGNGTVYVRLFDVTRGVAIQGSEAQASSQSSTPVVASPVVFGSGNNLIRVQVKSLTADTAIFDSGRLKIITEN